MVIPESLENLSQQLIPSDVNKLNVVDLARFEFIQHYMGRESLIEDKPNFIQRYIEYESEEVKDEKSFVIKLRGLNPIFQLQEEKEAFVKLGGLTPIRENMEKFMYSDHVRCEVWSIMNSLLTGKNRGNLVISRWSLH